MRLARRTNTPPRRSSASTATISSASCTTDEASSVAEPPADSTTSGNFGRRRFATRSGQPVSTARSSEVSRSATVRGDGARLALTMRVSCLRTRSTVLTAAASSPAPRAPPCAPRSKRSSSSSRSDGPLVTFCAPAPGPKRARASRRMSRSPNKAASVAPSRATPRFSASTTRRARRGCRGNASSRRPTLVSSPLGVVAPKRRSSVSAASSAEGSGGPRRTRSQPVKSRRARGATVTTPRSRGGESRARRTSDGPRSHPACRAERRCPRAFDQLGLRAESPTTSRPSAP
jgi:hypothetical protein